MGRTRENHTLPFSDAEWAAAKAVAEAEHLPSRVEYFRNRLRKDCKRNKINIQALAEVIAQAGEQERF